MHSTPLTDVLGMRRALAGTYQATKLAAQSLPACRIALELRVSWPVRGWCWCPSVFRTLSPLQVASQVPTGGLLVSVRLLGMHCQKKSV